MRVGGGTVLFLGAILVGFAGVRPEAQEPPTLNVVLARAADYVTQLEHDLSGVVAEEHYEQTVVHILRSVGFGQRGGGQTGGFGRDSNEHRDLKSDVLLVRPEGTDEYIQFRDVFQVDGKPVRDRDDRLAKLFLNPVPFASERLRQIREDSSRYNIGDVSRNLNVPVHALIFLRKENQSRSSFTIARIGNAGQPWEITFREVQAETLIRTDGDKDLPARGRFRIDPASGRVLTSVLIAEMETVRANITVTYQVDPSLGFMVPSEMRELYSVPRGDDIQGKATYGRFRRFKVSTEEEIH